MVKKLLKHEFTYYIRTFGLFLPIVLVIGVMTRVFFLFDGEKTIHQILQGSSVFMLVISCSALLILSMVAGVVRFYKNLFSAEGYLSLTLPVTNDTHIFVKLVAALVCQLVCLLVAAGAAAIAISGDLLTDIWQDFSKALDVIWEGMGAGHCVALAVEFTLILLVSAVANMLLYYACITVGQTAKKNRILMAIVAYFVYYVASQVLATIFTIVITIMGMTEALNEIILWVAYHPMATMHIYMWLMVILSAGLAALFWFVTRKIMTNKLNLE